MEYKGSIFEKDTKAIVWGQQIKAIQGMLDFDFVCGRSKPSVVASTYPFTGDHKQKFYFGHKEILIPAYKSIKDAFEKHPDATVMVTFASLRSVFETVLEAMHFPQVRVIAIIAEGVPENLTRKLIKVKCAFFPSFLFLSHNFRSLMISKSPLSAPPPSAVSSPAASRSATPAA